MMKILFLVLFLVAMLLVGLAIFRFMNRLTKRVMKHNGPDDHTHLHRFDE